jgi:hypothetical protein
VTFAALFLFAKRSWMMLICFLLYPILVKIYHPSYIYGIGYGGFLVAFDENFVIIVWSIVVFLTEAAAAGAVKLIKSLIKAI